MTGTPPAEALPAVAPAVLAGGPAADGIWAAHPFVTAIPFFFPTLIIIAVIGIVIWRDRHADPAAASTGDDDPAEPSSGEPAGTPADDGTSAERP